MPVTLSPMKVGISAMKVGISAKGGTGRASVIGDLLEALKDALEASPSPARG